MSLIAAPFAILAILYAGGFLAQLLGNYATWKQGGGIPGDGTSPLAASPDFLLCLSSVLRPPYGVYGILICIGLLAVLLIMVMRMGYGDAGEYDEDRNFSYSAKGTYGTSGWMSRKEMSGVLDLVPDLRKHKGVVLGMLDGKAVCIPEDTRINGNLAVYGASGSMKTRSFCMNRILQATVRGENSAGESLIICDPKSELYEKSSEFLRSRGYCVKVFNLVSPENSDSWCCLAEVEGQELMAQLFVDVIIKNTTNNGKSDHFWDACEMNLLKALVLYVDQGYAEENRNIGEVYRLLTLNGESQLDTLFEALPSTHPAKAPYSLFKQASDTVRSGVIIGLGSRLQVFQSELIKKITAKNEIDLELPGQQPCAYFLVTSDQDSTFDFLASLFLSFCFIKLVRYADVSCQQECQNCSPRMTKLCILKFLLKKIQLSSFFLYLNIPKNTFKHFLKMILNFDNLLNLFVPFIWHFTQCHFSSFNPIYIPLYHILYASLSLIFIFSDSDDVRSASS